MAYGVNNHIAAFFKQEKIFSAVLLEKPSTMGIFFASFIMPIFGNVVKM